MRSPDNGTWRTGDGRRAPSVAPGTDRSPFKVTRMHPNGVDTDGANCLHPRNEDGAGLRTLSRAGRAEIMRGRQRHECRKEVALQAAQWSE